MGTGFIAGFCCIPRYGREEWFSFVAFGLTIGAIYALIALGYTMVYGILRMVNFAHGDVFMFRSYAACFALIACNRAGILSSDPALSFVIATVVCILVSGGIAVLGERIAYRPFLPRPVAWRRSSARWGSPSCWNIQHGACSGAQNKAFPEHAGHRWHRGVRRVLRAPGCNWSWWCLRC